VIDGLAIAAIVCSLAVAGWAFVAAARHRPPSRPLFVALAVVAAVVVVQAAIVVVRLVGGAGPTGVERVATLVGYLLVSVLLPPVGAVLARLEPTRWGSALVGAACLVLPVMVVRLEQVWGG
jgi:hypothetical protein